MGRTPYAPSLGREVEGRIDLEAMAASYRVGWRPAARLVDGPSKVLDSSGERSMHRLFLVWVLLVFAPDLAGAAQSWRPMLDGGTLPVVFSKAGGR